MPSLDSGDTSSRIRFIQIKATSYPISTSIYTTHHQSRLGLLPFPALSLPFLASIFRKMRTSSGVGELVGSA